MVKGLVRIPNRLKYKNAPSIVKPLRPVRLYTLGTVLGYRRSHHHQYPQWSLVKIEGVTDKKDTEFYLGKRIAYIYKGKRLNKRTGSNIRVIWGKVCRPHGNNGAVRCRFRRNLPPKAFGATVRVMLYPSRV